VAADTARVVPVPRLRTENRRTSSQGSKWFRNQRNRREPAWRISNAASRGPKHCNRPRRRRVYWPPLRGTRDTVAVAAWKSLRSPGPANWNNLGTNATPPSDGACETT
jgi:hypothetical protein